MNRWLAFLPLAALAALAVLFVGWSLKKDPTYRPDAAVGRDLPQTVLPMLDGSVVSERNLDLKTAGVGRPMIVNLFASWCAPCRVEHPRLMALKDRGIAVVGVAYKDEPEATAKMLEELGDPFSMVLVDADGRAGLDLGVSGVPESFAVDAMGRVVAKQSGPLVTDADVERLVAALQAPARLPPTASERSRPAS